MGSTIAILTELLPLISNIPNAIMAMKSLIASLQSGGNATAMEITQLQALDARCDAAFERAAMTAGAQPEA